MSERFEGLPRIDLRAGAPTGEPEGSSAAHHSRWAALCGRSAGLDGQADEAAAVIVASVAERGDDAVAEFTERFEGRKLAAADFELPMERAQEALAALDPKIRESLELAADQLVALLLRLGHMVEVVGVREEVVSTVAAEQPLPGQDVLAVPRPCSYKTYRPEPVSRGPADLGPRLRPPMSAGADGGPRVRTRQR